MERVSTEVSGASASGPSLRTVRLRPMWRPRSPRHPDFCAESQSHLLPFLLDDLSPGALELCRTSWQCPKSAWMVSVSKSLPFGKDQIRMTELEM